MTQELRIRVEDMPHVMGKRRLVSYFFLGWISVETSCMARQGENPNDMRSESERVKPRAGGEPIERESLGYVRASERSLEQRVLVALQGEPEWSNATINVEARDSTVWLKGSVDTMNAKYRLEEVVKRVRGVESIENELAIRVGEALEEFTRNADVARLRDEHGRRTRRE